MHQQRIILALLLLQQQQILSMILIVILKLKEGASIQDMSIQALMRRIIPVIPLTVNYGARALKADAILNSETDLRIETNFTKIEFNTLHTLLSHVLARPKQGERVHKTKLNTQLKLLLVIMWLRKYHTLESLTVWFGIGVSTAWDYIHTYVPRIAEYMQPEVHFPSAARLSELQGTIQEYPNAVGSVDMTIHRIQRPRDREYRFYRGDKHGHFMNHLYMVDFMGLIIHAEPGFSGRYLDSQAYDSSLLRYRMRFHQGIS
jgi:hypothetical protein